MFSKVELMDAVDQITQSGKHTIQNCERLASLYTVLDHMDKEYTIENRNIDTGYSYDSGSATVKEYGMSDFLQSIAGVDERTAWLLMDELMDALKVLNPKLYNSVMDKIEE